MYVVVAAVVVLVGRPLGSRVFWLAAIAPVWTVATAIWAMGRLGSGPLTESWEWVGALGLTIGFRLDWFSVVLLLLVGGIGALVFVYSVFYFPPAQDARRTAATLVLFAGAMTGLVTSDNLLLLFTFWELTSVTSFLLIGTKDGSASARSAALHALLVTGAGGLAMLGGFVLLGEAAGTYSLHAILSAPPEGATVTVALVLVLVGALTKSAQVPFHSWLPGAMAAPTPISAYLHSATMVKAGVYLVARFAPAFATVGPWRWIVLCSGAASLLLGGYRALRQHDLKLVLAFGTISQLGLLMILFGAGLRDLALAGCVLLVAHAVFKAALFMVVGIVDHQTGTRDLRVLHGLGRRWPAVAVVAALATASMAAVPPFLGFVGKEAALYALLEPDTPARAALLVAVVLGSVFTVAYSARFLWGGFGGPVEGPSTRPEPASFPAPSPSGGFVAAPALLAFVGLVLGLFPDSLSTLVGDSLAALGLGDLAIHLSLWHGVNTALVLSILILASGLAMFLGRRTIERLQGSVPALPSASGAIDASIRGLLDTAGRVTRVVQSGSLPVYLTVLLTTLVVVPGVPLLRAGGLDGPVEWIDAPMQIVLGVVMIAAAVAAAVTRRRFAAVLLLGAVGYGMAGLFVVQGAPDLALTQVLVETVAVVAFVLVLRHLPEGFTPAISRSRRVLPAVAGVMVGAFVFWFALSASSVTGTPTPDPRVVEESADATGGDDRSLSEEFLARSLPEANGRNVVNVIIVDFRAFDTLGEIAVLLIAGLGVVALVRFDRRDRDEDGSEDEQSPASVGGDR